MKLYDIAKEYEQIINELYDDEDNINPQALTRLEGNEIALEKKAVALASWVKNMMAERDAIEEAKKAMLAREKSLKNKIEYWKENIKDNMERRGINEIKCPYFILKVKKNPESVDDFDPKEIPDEYKRITVTLDKQKMRSEMMEGVIIPGARLKQDTSLTIR